MEGILTKAPRHDDWITHGWVHGLQHDIQSRLAGLQNCTSSQQKHRDGSSLSVALPDDAKCAIADGAVRLHLRGAGHLARRVAVGLRHRCSAAGASSQSGGVTRGSCRGGGSGQARRGAEARGGGSARGVHTEILGAQLGARKQVPAHGLPACAVERHLLPAPNGPLSLRRAAAARLGADGTRLLKQHDPSARCVSTGESGHDV